MGRRKLVPLHGFRARPNKIAVYSNSLMATLNARKGLRDASSYARDSTVSLHNMHPTDRCNQAQLGVCKSITCVIKRSLIMSGTLVAEK